MRSVADQDKEIAASNLSKVQILGPALTRGLTESLLLSRGRFGDVVISNQDVSNFVDRICTLYSLWVIDSIDRDITYENDPPWDHSGSIISETSSEGALLEKYDTLGAWMDDAYTGQSDATFESGCGLRYFTYSTEVDYLVRDFYADVVRIGIVSDDDREDFIDSYVGENLDMDIEQVLVEAIQKIACQYAWVRGRERALGENEEQAVLSAAEARQHEKFEATAMQWAERTCQGILAVKLDGPSKSSWQSKVMAAIKLATDDELRALSKFGTCPLNFSNSYGWKFGTWVKAELLNREERA